MTTQFLCNFCNEIIDTYDNKDEMLKHISEHNDECSKKTMKEENLAAGKPLEYSIDELKSFLEQSIRNDDEAIDFLHNSRGKKDEDWYEKWSRNKVKGLLKDTLYSPVCVKLCKQIGIKPTDPKFDELLNNVIVDIVNGIW